ncbi:unnamed protein product [Thelazia callipaeda]|uniref:Uncharacterized protein n=1 Tax=Thelazia callipaeda TaxID=103827 RepID=A0A0N5DCF5_THECL|nr:unnamed protein product [Thelazia callipaeda]
MFISLHDSEAFHLLQLSPQGLIVTTSFWSLPALINDINTVKANYIKGEYFYELANNALHLRCRATNFSTYINKKVSIHSEEISQAHSTVFIGSKILTKSKITHRLMNKKVGFDKVEENKDFLWNLEELNTFVFNRISTTKKISPVPLTGIKNKVFSMAPDIVVEENVDLPWHIKELKIVATD